MEELPVSTRRQASEPLRLRSASWERIQLVLAFDGPAPPLALLHEGGRDRMPPTRQWEDGDRAFARFNVFQGPRQQPLAPGRWQLVGEADDAVRIDPGPVVPDAGGLVTERVLRLPRAGYRVQGRFGRPSGTFALEIGFDGSGAPDDARTIGDRARWRWRRVRRTAWRGGFALFRRLVRRGRPVVLFATRLTPQLAGNLQVVRDRMVARGLDGRYEMVTVVKEAIDRPLSPRDRLRLFVALARAEIIFLDDSFYPVYGLDFPRDVRIVQLWHASGAFKTVGYSRSAVDASPPFDPFGSTHKNTTHVIVSSTFDVPFYAEALGVPEARVHPTGIPRMDRFFDPEARRRAMAEAREALPGISGHTVWLFAPTYRGDRVATATYDLGQLDLERLHRLAAAKDAVVVFKMHPFVRERVQVPPGLDDRLIEASDTRIDINDLLFSVDLLITDYSSIVFEYSVLNRPMLFFAYDLGDYGTERDFYVPFEEFVPGRIVRTFDQMVEAIERDELEFEKVEAFAHRHFAHLDGSSTDRVIDMAVGP